MVASLEPFIRAFRTSLFKFPAFFQIFRKFRQFCYSNSYGLFAVMTTQRIELEIEGSDDGDHWIPYQFKYKPGNLLRRPPWILGHMPRLDWQLWFCSLRRFPAIPPWFLKFLVEILAGNEVVLGLLDSNPFSKEPPKWLRVVRYDYKFTSVEEWKRTGHWWKRKTAGKYLPFNLKNPKYEVESTE